MLIKNAQLQGQTGLVDIRIQDGKIVEIAPKIEKEDAEQIDAKGWLVTTPFVEPHVHLDTTLDRKSVV